MITLLKKSNYQKSLWKNGRGTTLQIAIFPPTADVQANNFLWRISSARVALADSFSFFEGYERQLIVWTGKGLKLNNIPLLPYSPLTFSGETPLQCELIDNEAVTDLGIIYKKDQVGAKLSVLTCRSGDNLKLETGEHFLFLADVHNCLLNNISIESGDTLHVQNEDSLIFYSTSSASASASLSITFFLITVIAH